MRFLGLEALCTIVLEVETRNMLGSVRTPKGFSFERLEKHSALTCKIAQELTGRTGELADTVRSASLLQHSGQLVLLHRCPDAFAEVIQRASAPGQNLTAHERAVLTTTHGAVGAVLLSIWGLPVPLVRAIAYHDEPGLSGEEEFGPVGMLHVASSLAAMALAETDPAYAPLGPNLDPVYLENVGMMGKIEAWATIAQDAAPSV